MKAITRSFLCALAISAVFIFTCMFAMADGVGIQSIKADEIANGTAIVAVDPQNSAKAIITLCPDEGYLAAAVSLKAADGTETELTKTESNEYTCTIPAAESTLCVQFRTARVEMNVSELAMSSGEKFTVTASLSCTDGELDTRENIADRDIVFASSDPAVVSIEPKTGLMKANKMGYARITANAAAGNGVEGFFYVIVDGDKSPVIGTIQLNAHFEEQLFVDTFLPGHGFLLFTNTSGHDITISTKNFFQSEIPTKEFYDAVDNYDGTGYDPITYFYITNGEYETDDNLDIRLEYAAPFFTRYERGTLDTYTIRNNDIATFGNTGSTIGYGETSDFQEVLERYGKSFELEKIKSELLSGRIDFEEYLYRVAELVNEICYDLTTDYNPFNQSKPELGGACLNHELYAVAYNRDYTKAAACKTEITQVQLEALVDFLQYDNRFSILERNCSLVASDGWNLVTAAKPQYNITPNVGGVTNALAAPLFLRNAILSKAVLLSADTDIEFYNGIDVIKPAKNLGEGCTHNFVDGKCTECGAADPEYSPKLTVTSFFSRVLTSIMNMLRGMFSWLPFC